MELNTKKSICRACLTKEGSFQSLFLKENSSCISMNVSSMLSACATIQVKEGDGLPDQICSECSEQTVKMYLFKLRCERSDIILREILEKCQPESVKIKNEHEDNAIDEIFSEELKINDYKCNLDKEMWENEEKISYNCFKEESKTKEFGSDICQENIDQDDLLTNQEIFKNIKVEKLEIIDEDIKIKYNSSNPLLMKSKESLFPCLEYDSIFSGKKNLDEVISGLHIKREPEVLKTGHELTEINSLLKNNPHGCDICFEGFSQKSELKKHIKTHTLTSKQTGEKSTISDVVSNKGFRKSFKCDICWKSFTDSSHFRRHRKIHTGEKPFQCEICNKKFANSSNLKIHKRVHTGEKPYECEVCKKKFSLKNTLVAHKRVHTHEKPYKCDVCKKKFNQSQNLMVHKRIHTGEKPYECDLCKKRFTRSHTLVKHKRLHTGEKPFKCEICEKHFADYSNLVCHKKIHSVEKPLECEICKKKFTRSSDLNDHKRIHTGEKPFQCEICNKKCRGSSGLNRHNKLHTGEKLFKCYVCQMKFSDAGSLKRHKTTHNLKNRTSLAIYNLKEDIF